MCVCNSAEYLLQTCRIYVILPKYFLIGVLYIDIYNLTTFLLLVRQWVFPKWSATFTEFSKFRENDNHWSMNWAQFKDPVSHMCCAGAVVACWPLTQEVARGRGSTPFTEWHFFSLNSGNSVTKIYNHLGKTLLSLLRKFIGM